MARIAGIDIPRNKRVEIALTYIYGIGRKTSNDILKQANVNPDMRVKELTEEEVGKLRNIIENEEREHYTIGTSGTNHYLDLLPEEESKRIKVSDNPDYYIETYRGKIGNNPEKKGYSIVYSIKVDGFDISSVYKKNDIK